MRKLMMLAAMVAVVLVAAAPAMAQLAQEFSQEDVESGDVEPTVEISNKGNNVNICGTVLQSANSGNVQNEQGVVDRKSTRLNSSHANISYAVFCLKKKNKRTLGEHTDYFDLP